MKKRYWRIEGFDSSDRVFRVDVPISSYSENQLQRLLQTLAAKAGLTDQEIVETMGKRGTKFSSALLEVHQDKHKPAYSCGENPHFHARVIEKDGA